ncbi:MAG: FKBP-type peptidyl-prolyl cis-trans isomerase [Bacteroidales bacterium]|nr:FKBP-type peptidyl-prolyl cis-trans isomerase [Bacteroidales bacterium]
MKKILITAATLLLIASVFTSCGRSELRGFNRTETGLHYRFYVKSDSPRAQIGDIIVGEMWVHIDEELNVTNAGNPDVLAQVELPHSDDLLYNLVMEAFQMIGVGDSVKFAICLDMLRGADSESRNPFIPEGNIMFYTFKVTGIYSPEEFELRMQMEQIIGEAIEAEMLAAFLEEEGVTAQPNDDGVYVIITNRGTGARATTGRMIQMHYVGRLIDGTVFDTSFEDVAREHGLFTPMRQYDPLEFPVGVGQMIPGMDNALVDMRAGTRATLIIPSNMAYGGHAMGMIPAFSTLIFDIEIVAVN